MIKLRYLLPGYAAVMLIVLLMILGGFRRQAGAERDMVFYNEQRILVQQAVLRGEERARIEQDMGCDILLISDEDYEMRLNKAYQNEALVMDLAPASYAAQSGTSLESAGKIVWNVEERHYRSLESGLKKRMTALWGILLLGGLGLLGFFYVRLIRPFRQLEIFAGQVAKGNLDFPLPVKKHNYFGAFTESFDLMREELKRAKESEYQANRSKKELVAELSHDIKTPVATIRATCEVMQVREQSADTLAKVAVIDAKAKLVDELITNLFQASLEELEVLKVEPLEESSAVIGDIFRELSDYSDIRMQGAPPSCLVYMDRLRLQQVIDNVVNNAQKYAGTPVTVGFWETGRGIGIRIRDEGEGVDPEELPYLAEKFYRGGNAKGKAGSGLGLYLAGQFMERMHGGLEYYNENGFVVELLLRKV